MRFEIPDTSRQDSGGEEFEPARCDCAHCDSRGRYEQRPDCRFYTGQDG